jgi:hypothetical protein
MQKWEFAFLETDNLASGDKVVRINGIRASGEDRNELFPLLTKMGLEGWEVVTVLGDVRISHIVLKRSLVDQSKPFVG